MSPPNEHLANKLPRSTFARRHTQVKISPETYIRFDGTKDILLSNVYSDGQALQIQSDILLILWDIAEFKPIGEILDTWPDPIDHPKIIDHLYNLYTVNVVMVDEESNGSVAAPLGERLPDKLHHNLHFNAENHVVMLKDHVRLSSYRRAIERAITPDSVVMDLGCGTGILSFFSAKAGAKQVYAVEKRQDMLKLAEEIGKTNEIDNIDYVFGASSQLEANRFGEKPNILVAEILGNQILEEHVLEFTLDARDRLLAKDAKLIPYKLAIEVVGFHSDKATPREAIVGEFKHLYGIDYAPLAHIVANKHMRHTMKYNPQLDPPITDVAQVKTLDLRTLDNTTFSAQVALEVTKTGVFGGYAAWFKAWLDEETILTNSPWAPDTHWTQLVHLLPKPIAVEAGQTIYLDAIYDGVLRFHFRRIASN